jgi:CHAT domain-containing protein
MAVVVQDNADGYPPLPYTIVELQKISQYVPSDALTVFGPRENERAASVSNVASQLSDISIIHFACHGKQDLVNPLNSSLILEDGELKISQIMEKELPNASLAFLSACQTAKGDGELPDEAIHLAASLLFAGFRGVVATMWSVDYLRIHLLVF